MTWDPETYPHTIRSEIHDYEELQERVVQATTGFSARKILDLGIGAGETATRVLRMHPDAHLVGIDSSTEMLRAAAESLPEERVTLLERDLSAPLPDERFDLVVSALAVHHLRGDGKSQLFGRIRQCLAPGSRFVMGDVVIPEDRADAVIGVEAGYDFPSTVEEQLQCLADAGFSAELLWRRRDLAVLVAQSRA